MTGEHVRYPRPRRGRRGSRINGITIRVGRFLLPGLGSGIKQSREERESSRSLDVVVRFGWGGIIVKASGADLGSAEEELILEAVALVIPFGILTADVGRGDGTREEEERGVGIPAAIVQGLGGN